MRLILTLVGKKGLALPVHYNHLVQGAIYQQIAQPALRRFLHEEGFALGPRRFKLFTFSRLLGEVKISREEKKALFFPPLKLVIASPVSFLIEELARSFLKQEVLLLGEARLAVAKVEVAAPVVRKREATLHMLSPLTVYSTLEKPERYTYYYSPFEPRFGELVLENLAKKYLLIFARPAEKEGFSITPEKVSPRDFKVTVYKGTVVKGWMGTYRLTGDPQLLEVALDAGLGAKNSQGFGCCELCDE